MLHLLRELFKRFWKWSFCVTFDPSDMEAEAQEAGGALAVTTSVRVRSVVSDSVAPWTVARLAPLPTEFSRQEYWSVLPFPIPGDLPDPGIGLTFLVSPVLAGRLLTTRTTWETLLGYAN